MKMIRHLISCAILMFVCITTIAAGTTIVHAQSTSTPTLQILTVDISQYPEVAVTISGANIPAPLSALPATLTIDNQPLPIVRDESSQQGIQLLLAVDVNRLVTRNDAGQSGFVALNGTLLDLVDANALVRNQDWFAAYQLQGDDEPRQLQAWTQEPNQLLNSVIANRPTEITDAPLTAGAINALIVQMADLPEAIGRAKVLLLFTTGATTADFGLVAQGAQQANVAVHVVELLSDVNQTPNGSLQSLATASGGRYTALSRPDQSSDVTDALTALHAVRTLQARVTTTAPETLRVAVTLPDGRALEATETDAFANLTLTPAEIRLVEPTTPVDWTTLTAVAAEDGNPHLLPVRIAIAWPNAQERALQQVSYTLHGPNGFAQQVIRTEAPFDEAALALDNAQNGDYTLEIRAIDELGLESTSVANTIQLSNVPTTLTETAADAGAQSAQEVAAPETNQSTNAAALPIASANDNAAPSESIQLPGLAVSIPRALLLWSLPILLFLIAYLLYSERRSRRQEIGAPANRDGNRDLGKFATAAGQDPRYHLRGDDEIASADKRFVLDGNKEPSTQRYVLQGDHAEDGSAHEQEKHSRGQGTKGRLQPAMVPHMGGNDPYGEQPLPALRAEQAESAWLDLRDTEEEITETPTYHEDDEATYRTQEVARSVLGYLVRTTSDPTLPQELPIYNVGTPSGTARQIYIGRHSQHNTLVINDKRISREHAVIIQRNGQLYLRDNGSTAGTFLNWKRLTPGEELLLRHNDLIGFGQIAYEFRLGNEDEATIVTG